MNGDVAFDGETNHVPDTEEVADMRNVCQYLTRAVQLVHIERRTSRPRQHHGRKKTDPDDADRSQIDVGRASLHVALTEHEQGDEVADEAGNDDDGCDTSVQQASYDSQCTTAS